MATVRAFKDLDELAKAGPDEALAATVMRLARMPGGAALVDDMRVGFQKREICRKGGYAAADDPREVAAQARDWLTAGALRSSLKNGGARRRIAHGLDALEALGESVEQIATLRQQWAKRKNPDWQWLSPAERVAAMKARDIGGKMLRDEAAWLARLDELKRSLRSTQEAH